MAAGSPIAAFADDAAGMAKKLQNPLANIKAIMTDNAIGFEAGEIQNETNRDYIDLALGYRW